MPITSKYPGSEGKMALMTAMQLTQGLIRYAEGIEAFTDIVEEGAHNPKLLQLGAVTYSLIQPISRQLGMIFQELEAVMDCRSTPEVTAPPA